ncbi:LacI family DNA-binding transcriptional regulator [Psychromonas hadalis]|uniref:LacI family DNA-binding transcriptional regulator n=1 Tax=Psychromonas hadalis TaxID=211669 RepID=UPI0003B5241D|nr:LacI family DNA-binding transcriptional regulator [Psychromonas hadalis]
MGKTITEVAKATGFSITTVKLVVNNKAKQYRISEKTQIKIKDYVKEHGIMINQVARSLKLNKTNTLGLVIPRLTNRFFSSLAQLLEQLCCDNGYQLITVCSGDSPEREEEVSKNLIARGVDGLFIVPSSKEQQLLSIKYARNKPIVFLDRNFEIEGQSTVISDNYAGFLQLSKAILKKSTSDIYLISGDNNLPSIKHRLQGFVDAHKDLKKTLVHNWIISVPHNQANDGFEGMKALHKELKQLPEAIVFSSLPILEGALHYLKLHYGVIPSQLIIGTFDDHNMLDFLPNSTYSVKQDTKTIVENCCSIMLSLLKNIHTKPANYVVKPKLIHRN